MANKREHRLGRIVSERKRGVTSAEVMVSLNAQGGAEVEGGRGRKRY